ncbi:protein of unknown function [Bradyrhizobium vignae]|uniref:Uncharacterized protein n=1 Tax=Bradyrhizobium vignae TaxID=1549949 RepID=A0A2U3Q6D5_9BRAD|nr:protein of unknown function [Bradyrhizobium vignae]
MTDVLFRIDRARYELALKPTQPEQRIGPTEGWFSSRSASAICSSPAGVIPFHPSGSA